MKAFISIASLLLILTGSNLLAISAELENKLLEKALIEGAVTVQQKSAVSNYLVAIAAEKRKQAGSYKEMAGVNYGGKAAYQYNTTMQLLHIAKSLEREAKSYEDMSGNFKTN